MEMENIWEVACLRLLRVEGFGVEDVDEEVAVFDADHCSSLVIL